MIKNRDDLLDQLANELTNTRLHHVSLGYLEAVLLEDGKEIIAGGVGTIMGFLACNTYYSDEGDWSQADTAVVRVL